MQGFTFDDIREPTFERVDSRILAALRRVQGLTATASDVLDGLGWNLAVPAALLAPRFGKPIVVAGHALTLRYIPERRRIDPDEALTSQSKLAHQIVFGLAQRGDVMVVEASVRDPISVLGGRAATAGAKAGVAGAIVDGGVRDIEEIRAAGFPVWSKWVTPISGKGRLEPATINGPVSCLGVQVHPGDLVLADETGVCFIPLEVASDVVTRILEVAKQEAGDLRARRVRRSRPPAAKAND
jgi:4-hydroxy-4-methyl-2-oxoglutarate aldolase